MVNQCLPDACDLNCKIKNEDGQNVKMELNRLQEEYSEMSSEEFIKPAHNRIDSSNEADRSQSVLMEYFPTNLGKGNELDVKVKSEDFVKIEFDSYEEKNKDLQLDEDHYGNNHGGDHQTDLVLMEYSQTDSRKKDGAEIKEVTVKIETDSYNEESVDPFQEKCVEPDENYSENSFNIQSVSAKYSILESEDVRKMDIKVEIEENIRTENVANSEDDSQKLFEEAIKNVDSIIKNGIKETEKCRSLSKKQQFKFARNDSSNLKFRRKRRKEIPVSCGVCQRKISHPSDLKRHLLTHFKEAEYVHELKSVEVYDKLGVKSSTVAKINGKEYSLDILKCKKCDYQTTKGCSFTRHIKGKHLNQKEFKCDACEFSTSYSSHLKLHQRKHDEASMFQCDICQKQKTQANDLKRHMFTHLKEAENILEEDSVDICENLGVKNRVIAAIKGKKYELEIYKCKACEYTTSLSSSFHCHVKGLHLNKREFKCEACKYTTYDSSNLKRHQKTHNEVSMFKCNICQKEIKQANYLKRHMASHLQEAENTRELSSVDICGKSGVKSRIIAEIKGEEYDLEIYKCKQCEYMTPYISRFHCHMKGVHLNKRDFKCDVCEFSTSYSSDLKVHQRRHEKVSMFICSICDRENNRSVDLKRHILTHFKEAENIHELNSMEICGKLGVKSSVVAKIKGNDYNLEVFKCRKCDYQTLQSYVFIRHIKMKHFNESKVELDQTNHVKIPRNNKKKLKCEITPIFPQAENV